MKKIIGEGLNDHKDQRPIDETGKHAQEGSSQSYSTDDEPAHNNHVLAEAIERAQASGDSRPEVIEKARREREARIAARNAELERTGQVPKKTLIQQIYGVDLIEDIDSVTINQDCCYSNRC